MLDAVAVRAVVLAAVAVEDMTLGVC